MTENEQQQLLYTQILLNLMQQNMNELVSRIDKAESKINELIALVQSLKG